MKPVIICAVLFLALLAPVTHAAEGGVYLGVYGGASLVDDSRNKSGAGTFNLDFKSGYAGAVTLGFDLRDDYPHIGVGRVELEVAHRNNRLDAVEYQDGALMTRGDVKVTSLMLNTFGEYRGALPFIPYIGGGIGLARVEMDGVRFGELLLIDDSDLVFAWQVGAGLGYRLGSFLTLDLAYRYFSAVDPGFRDAQGVRFDSEYDNHEVLLGVRFDF